MRIDESKVRLSGDIELGHGYAEIRVLPGYCVDHAYVRITEEGAQVCGGSDESWVSCQGTTNGIVLRAYIASNRATVEYIIPWCYGWVSPPDCFLPG